VLFREHAAAGLTLAEIIETTLRMSKVGLIDICEQAGLEERVNLLVVVDQFEELFRYRQLVAVGRRSGENIGEDAAAFVNLLLEVKERATCRIYVVLTMRSDFLGDCTQFLGLAEAINAGQYLVPRMTRDERRAAIEGPIGVGGAEIAPVLLTRLVNDVGDNPDQLSILQHALNRTWALWQNEGGKGLLNLTHYEAIGTMAHALDQHAEQAYAELGTARQQKICEKLFKALTDKATDPRGVRRPSTLGELCVLADASAAEVADVIAVFRDPSRSFLMPPAGEALEMKTVVDISHESLMRVWRRLIKWTDEEVQSARIYCRLADTADLHEAGNANLLRDPELQLALDWREKSQPKQSWASRYHPGFAAAMHFLTESSDAREAERAGREQQRQREREAEREKAQAQARYALRMRWAAVFCGALAVIAGLFAAAAVSFGVRAYQKEAEAHGYLHEMQITQSRSLVSAAAQSDQATRILLALEALPDVGEKRPLVFDAQKSLIEGLNDLRELTVVRGHTGSVNSVAVMPDGTRIVTASGDRTARVWDAQTGAELLQIKGHTGAVFAMAVTPDGARIVTGSPDGTARIWDARTGAEELQLKGHTDAVFAVAVTPDGARIVTGSADRTARIWDARSGAELLQLKGHTGAVFGVAVTPDGGRIVTGSRDATARVWDAQTGAELLQIKATDAIWRVAVTPDGARIVTGSPDGTARIWDARTATELLELKGHSDSVNSVAVMPDGDRVVTASADRTARIWDARTGAELLQLKGHSAAVFAMAVTPDGARIVTGSEDNTARVWDARTGAELLQLKGHSGAVLAVAVTPDGAHIVTGSPDRTARIWDARTGAELLQLKGHTDSVSAVAVTPDGGRIVTGSNDGTARVWDATTGVELLQLKGHADEACSKLIAFLFPTGGLNKEREARLAELLKSLDPTDALPPLDIARLAQYADKRKRLLDAAIRTNLIAATGPEPQANRTSVETHCAYHVNAVAVTPDGARIVTGSDDSIARVWDATTGLELLQLKGHIRPVWDVTVTPDGARIVTASADRTARIWDARTGAELLQLRGHTGTVSAVAVTPEGGRVLTGSLDKSARVWDASTGAELLQLRGHTHPVNSVAVTPDGGRVITGSQDATSRLWDLARQRQVPPPRQALIDYAKAVVPRCLTIEQRKTFLLRPMPPRWCIEMRKYPYDADD
jgi:WD40 repeat protein